MIETHIEVYVDADAMPKSAMAIVRQIAPICGATVTTVSSIRHELKGEHHISVDPAPEATDFEIIRRLKRNTPTLVITQDYGLAALVLAKQAMAISPTGRVYTTDNIDALLSERALNAKLRRSPKHRIRGQGPRPRNAEDDERFESVLRHALSKLSSKTSD